MSAAISITSLEKASRTSAILMTLGAVVVGASLWIASSRLHVAEQQVATLETRANELGERNRALEAKATELTAATNNLKQKIGGLRSALTASRQALMAFHQRDYSTAIRFYDDALAADPDNAYLLNLKAYSEFKLNRPLDAVTTQTKGIEVDPTYVYGLFDLARFQCAAGDKIGAAKSFREAVTKEARFGELAKDDGEFQRLCGKLSP